MGFIKMRSAVVLISGKQGSGKTTLAYNLISIFNVRLKGYEAHLLNFADPIYEIHDFARALFYRAKIEKYDFTKKDGRLLQLLGTEWGRNTVGPYIWVELLLKRVEQIKQTTVCENSVRKEDEKITPIFIVADCRFKNELLAFKDNSIKVRLDCGKEARKQRVSMWRENDSHPSEVDLDDSISEFDMVLDSQNIPAAHLAELVSAKILETVSLVKKEAR